MILTYRSQRRIAGLGLAAAMLYIGNGCESNSAPQSGDASGGTKAVLISAAASSLHQQETTLARSSGGRIVAVWIGFLDEATGAATIEYTISDDFGQSWSRPSAVSIPREVGVLNDPALIVDANGNFTLAALGFNLPGIPRHSGVYIYTLPAGASVFGPAVSVDQLDPTDQLFYFDKPQIARTPSGYLVTYSLMGSGGEGGLPISRAGIAATSSDGVNWRHDTLATNAPAGITLCAAGQSILAVYFSQSARGLWTVASDNDRTWQAPVVLDQGASGSWFPSCVGRGSDVWVLYATSANVARLARSTDGGVHFSTIPVDVNGSVSQPAFAVRADGTVDVGYYNSSNQLPFGFARSLLRPGGTAFEFVETIRSGLQIPTTRQGRNGLVDFIGFIPGAIAFTDNSSGTSHIAFVRYPAP
jgi:hypothetical protein